MDERTSARLQPLPPEYSPDLREQFESMQKNLGFHSEQHPDHAAQAQAGQGAGADDGRGVGAGRQGRSRFQADHRARRQPDGGMARFILAWHTRNWRPFWEYQTSPLYNTAERATLDFAVSAATVSNAVTDAMFKELRKHWTEEQIVEIVGVIALFGFLNRWNDTMATPLEDEPIEVGEKYLARGGWQISKHRS